MFSPRRVSSDMIPSLFRAAPAARAAAGSSPGMNRRTAFCAKRMRGTRWRSHALLAIQRSSVRTSVSVLLPDARVQTGGTTTVARTADRSSLAASRRQQGGDGMRSVFASLFSASLVMAVAFAPGDGLSGYDASCAPVQATLAARGDGDVKEPSLTEPTSPLPDNARGKGANAKFRATIPVYFHVVSPDGTIANVTDSQVADQIRVMNLAYGGAYGGAKTGFSFSLAGITRTTNADWFNAGPGSPDERAMKQTLSTNAPDALNYYSTTAGVYLGWAYPPGLSDS